ncbi:MAG: SRPBCC family protein [Roseiflexaceae bacterium]|nr:SRPBCC family protein [Roseiflexaceae bacterium]
MGNLTLIAEPGKQEITITREFNAPRELVFRVLTDPALTPKWWGPRGLTTIIDKMDVHAGGMWRFVQRDQQGNEFAFHGVYHAVIAPERVINTFEFEGMPGHVILETMTLEAQADGKTLLTASSVFQSVADRDGMLSSGMAEGSRESYERLDELLKLL